MFGLYVGGFWVLLLDFIKTHFGQGSFPSCIHIGCRGRTSSGIKTALSADLPDFPQKLSEMLFSGTADYYISSNGFFGSTRSLDSLFAIHNIVIDIDHHGADLDHPSDDFLDEFIWRLNHDVFHDLLPAPTSIVKTGRGLQLWWALTPVAAVYKSAFDDIIDGFLSVFQDYLQSCVCFSGFSSLTLDYAASRNIAGYFRLPTTNNTIACKKVTFESNGTHYSIVDLLRFLQDNHKISNKVEEVSETEPDKGSRIPNDTPLKVTKKRSESLSTFSSSSEHFFSLVEQRSQAFSTLRELRQQKIGAEQRNNLCFMFYNSLIGTYSHEISFQKLLDFNKGFVQPMTKNELDNVISSARKKGGYHYSNQKIVEFLGISVEECSSAGFSSPMVQKISKKTLTASKKEERNQKILHLYDSGKNLEQVSQELKISIPTIQKILLENNRSHKNERKEKILQFHRSGLSKAEIAKLCDCSTKTVQRALC